jgi:gamma-glutamyltranspeptidase/glutathione hydrolase
MAASATDPSVLLGPVQILLLGTGGGGQCVDGRLLQPGLGGKRPRGFTAGEVVPDAARAGVSRYASAVATALATHGTMSFSTAMGVALELAEDADRKATLERLASRGPLALAESGISRELLACLGALGGGTLTEGDLKEPRPDVCAITPEARGEVELAYVPFAPAEQNLGGVHIVAAADARGRGAIACFERSIVGTRIPALGLLAPSSPAQPVLRGVTRAAPGTPLAAAAPFGARLRRGALELMAGIGGGGDGAPLVFADLLAWLQEGAPRAGSLAQNRGAVGVVLGQKGAEPLPVGITA